MTRLSKLTGFAEQPIDRLGRIAQAMLQTAEDHPEYEDGDKAIIMLDTADTGMLAYGGYDPDNASEAFMNLLGQLDALAQANGMKLDFVPFDHPPGQG